MLAAGDSEIYRGFERNLEDWHRRYADRPIQEMIRLCLLSLEREENVVVAYRRNVLDRRLAQMPLPDPARRLVRHALAWVWQDEEMHAVYVRGALLRLGAPVLGLRTFSQQLAGALGGWAVSVVQHRRWVDAPAARALALALVWAGVAGRRVPAEIRRHLRYSTFREFSRYNAETEATAWLCWQRIAEMAARHPELLEVDTRACERIAHDEHCHRRVFLALADAIGDDGGLADDEALERLAVRLRDAGPYFVPRALRGSAAAGHPVGSGLPVFVSDLFALPQASAAFQEVLERSSLRDLVRRSAAQGGARVAVKVRLDADEAGEATDPARAAQLAAFLRAAGAQEVALVDCSTPDGSSVRGLEAIGARLGFTSPDYRLVDSARDQDAHEFPRGLVRSSVSRTWKEADVRLSLAPAGFSQDVRFGFGLANLEGVGGPWGSYLGLDRQAQRETAVLMLVDEFPPHWSIVHAAHPTQGRFFSGADALAVDDAVASRLCLDDGSWARMRRAADLWFGDGTS